MTHPSMPRIRHSSAGTRHLIPDVERARSQHMMVNSSEQVPPNPKEILDESVDG